MRYRKVLVLCYVLTIGGYGYCNVLTPSGFHLADSISEFTFRYKSINNLIILPFIINDSIPVNLILDTGTQNIILFGKHYPKRFALLPKHNVEFSGMGKGEPLSGRLSINNKVSLTSSLVGDKIAIVLVPKKVIHFPGHRVDGIIGYDIFSRFEVEINPQERTITFRTPRSRGACLGYEELPLNIDCTRPVIPVTLTLTDGTYFSANFMIDTGSDMAVLLKTADNRLIQDHPAGLIGRGLNGRIQGIRTRAKELTLATFVHPDVRTEIALSPRPTYGSIGMDILKEYVVVINYLEGFIRIRKI